MAEIIWTETALDELAAIGAYIALDKPQAAKRLVQRVFVRIDQLALFPLSGGKPRELSGTPYRVLVIQPLRLFYRLEADRIYIVYVMRGERRLRMSDFQDT
ncbi:MAG TPA: type II toxin-antitoxin system RelE/ParE family toxin [Lacunisphaera sp.]|jgi:toxin ParE1/3/4